MMMLVIFAAVAYCGIVVLANALNSSVEMCEGLEAKAKNIKNQTVSDWCQLLVVFVQIATFFAYTAGVILACIFVMYLV